MVSKREPTEKDLRTICEQHREAFATQGWGLSVHTEIARTYHADGGYTYHLVYVILFLPLSYNDKVTVSLPTNTLGYTPPPVSIVVSNGVAVIEPLAPTSTNFDYAPASDTYRPCA